jgi:16S rRNA (uracil1498-N3)-methyltransferase
VRPRFFSTSDLVPPDGPAGVQPIVTVTLSPGDAYHARTVLRARPGDPCELAFSPSRAVAEAVFEEVADIVTVRVTGWVSAGGPQSVRLLLVQALPQPKKVDEIVEKGTEVGIDSFLIVPAAGSPRVPASRVAAREARWRTIAEEAAKQSRQSSVPDLSVAASPAAALDQVRTQGWHSVLLDPGAGDHLGEVLDRLPERDDGPRRVALWVGPEGGWSREETAVLTASGCQPATLGVRVLRTETAGPVAAALARFALSDW